MFSTITCLGCSQFFSDKVIQFCTSGVCMNLVHTHGALHPLCPRYAKLSLTTFPAEDSDLGLSYNWNYVTTRRILKEHGCAKMFPQKHHGPKSCRFPAGLDSAIRARA